MQGAPKRKKDNMTALRRYTNKVEEFLHSDNGQRFFNIAYSVGAAIVIWGALFKILHLPGGNTLLCVGMGTEIAMFILTAFDRPPKEPNWDEIVPALSGNASGPQPVESLTIEDDIDNPERIKGAAKITGHASGPGIIGGGVIGGGVVGGGVVSVMPKGVSGDVTVMGMSAEDLNKASEGLTKANELTEATNRFVDAIEGISRQMGELHETMTSGSRGYAEKMADLNRNLAGLNTIYEIQLKSVSGQLEAFDKVNKGLREIRDMYEKSAADSAKYCEETEKLTQNMQQINEIYARMINALTINQKS